MTNPSKSGRKNFLLGEIGVETYKEQYPKEISLIRKGLSLKNISAITGTSINTIREIRDTVR